MLLGLGLVSCTDSETNPVNEEIHVTPTFITELRPIDDEGTTKDVSKNVIQGMASFEDGWFVTQTSANSTLLINYLDSEGKSLFHQRLSLDSHGQDLSLEQISDTELYLYTTIGDFDDNRSTGLLRLSVTLPASINGVRDMSLVSISPDREYPLNYTHATPAISEDKSHFAIRSNNTILVHEKQNIENDSYESAYHFELNSEQLKDNENRTMWFQGIIMTENLVYCLTGNAQLTTEKKIFTYDQSGITEDKYVFDADDFDQTFAEKFEPESLALIGNELYFTIMTKEITNLEIGNIKYLYKISI